MVGAIIKNIFVLGGAVLGFRFAYGMANDALVERYGDADDDNDDEEFEDEIAEIEFEDDDEEEEPEEEESPAPKKRASKK